MLELDVLSRKEHDWHPDSRITIFLGPLERPLGTPVQSASGANDKVTMFRPALTNITPGSVPYMETPNRTASTLLLWARHAQTRALVEVCMLLATLVVLALIIFLLYMHNAPTIIVCHNDVCEYYNKLLRESLGSLDDACHDFHHFVCSGWEATHEHSLHYEVQRRFSEKVSAEALAVIVPPSGQSATQKAAMFYKSCIRTSNTDVDHLTTIRELLLNAGVMWPELSNSTSLLRTLFFMASTWNWASPVHFLMYHPGRLEVRPDELYGTVLRKRDAMLKGTAQRSYYADYYERMAQAFSRPGLQELPYSDMFALESSAISRLLPSYKVTKWMSVDNASLDEFASLTENVFPKSAWEDELRNLANMTMPEYNAEWTFSVYNTEFFTAFFEFVATEGEQRASYYVGWCVVQLATQLVNQELVRVSYQTDKEVLEGHAQFCSTMADRYFGLAFYAGHMKQQNPKAVIEAVYAMMRNIRDAFLASINSTLTKDLFSAIPILRPESDLSEALRIIKELEDGVLNAAYSQFPDMSADIWENIAAATIAARRSDMDVRMKENAGSGDVSQIFFPENKTIFEFLPTAFEAPVFNTQALDATNYGALGSDIASAFADTLFTALLGADNETQSNFDARTSCFESFLPPNASEEANVQELLKRVVSLRMLYVAFHAPNDRPGTEMRLIGYPHITERQMLFIFWCLYQCHTPNAKYKCNVPVKVLRQFGAVFGCHRGNEMYTGVECPVLA
ncbi:hypothetical protein HPB50_025246 [Hyalomma asiaticum]|uniref:Uncharacterized protein n=1 Tax=Hyalomma asiaticum TaxID=266040 RepID=A0ACB7SKF4_HYAAI|nr:hypothetical protein HPB50_025246 [Hyalomma asiaticum]